MGKGNKKKVRTRLAFPLAFILSYLSAGLMAILGTATIIRFEVWTLIPTVISTLALAYGLYSIYSKPSNFFDRSGRLFT